MYACTYIHIMHLSIHTYPHLYAPMKIFVNIQTGSWGQRPWFLLFFPNKDPQSNQQPCQDLQPRQSIPSSWSLTNLLITSLNFTFYSEVNDMFMWLVQPCLEFIRLQCKFVVQTSPIHLAFSMMRLYSSLLGKWYLLFLSQMGVGCAFAVSSVYTPVPSLYHDYSEISILI